MKEKIIIVSDHPAVTVSLQKELIENSYDVMVSHSLISDIYEGQLLFLKAFDLVVLHEVQTRWLDQRLLQSLQILNLPLMIISLQGDPYGNYEQMENVYYPRVKQVNEYFGDIVKILSHLPLEETQEDEEVSGVYRAFQEEEVNDQYWMPADVAPKIIENEGYPIELQGNVLSLGSRNIYLSQREQELMQLLIEANYQPLPNSYLFREIWQQEYSQDKQAYIGNLVKKTRAKIMKNSSIKMPIILNQKSNGYFINNRFVINKVV